MCSPFPTTQVSCLSLAFPLTYPAPLSALPLTCPTLPLTLCVRSQVIASLPRGAARRLYTAPHSLLDTFPAQHPRQLLDIAADDSPTAVMASSAPAGVKHLQAGLVSKQSGGAEVNVLWERTRISPVSSAASIQSSESGRAAENQQHMATAAPHFGVKAPGMVTAETQTQPQAGVEPQQQHMGGTYSQHIKQPSQHYGSTTQAQHLSSNDPTQRQDSQLDECNPHLPWQHLGGSAVVAPGHPAPQLSSEPLLAPNPGAPPPFHEHQPLSEELAQHHPNLNLSRQGPAPTPGHNTPAPPMDQSSALTSPGMESVASRPQPSLGMTGTQHSFSVVPVDSADEAPEAELSQRQRALRSLSSKGVQTSRTVSGKGDRTPRDGSSEHTGKLPLGSWQGRLQKTSTMESEVVNDERTKDGGGEGAQQPVAQKTGTVRALASQLNLRSDSSKHLN